MSYPESVEYLYALGNELKVGAKFGLERMRALLDGLGNPEAGKRFVHVAGTNGKGSTSAIIASVLRAAAFNVGLNTSPHLIEPTERIRVNGRPVTKDEFAAAFATVHSTAEQLVSEDRIDAHPSYFETVTAMGFEVFRTRTDIAVMEVGLGGRLDATNVIAPELCVITPVAFDHEAFLGNTLEAIASEKAGILKPRVPVVLAPQNEQAARVIEERARVLESPVIQAAQVDIEDLQVAPYGAEFTLEGHRYHCPLAGRHQVQNALTAIQACRALGITTEHIQAGLRDTVWPGRLERVHSAPDFVLDGAHNPAGAQALANYIREFCGHRPVWLVYGAMRDKAIDEVTAQLFPLANRLIATAPKFPRALRPEAILNLYEHPNATVALNVPDSIDQARQAPPDAIVFFTGSLYLVGEARKLLLAEPDHFVK